MENLSIIFIALSRNTKKKFILTKKIIQQIQDLYINAKKLSIVGDKRKTLQLKKKK